MSSYRTEWDRDAGNRPTRREVREAERHADVQGIIELARLLGIYQARLEAVEAEVRCLRGRLAAAERHER